MRPASVRHRVHTRSRSSRRKSRTLIGSDGKDDPAALGYVIMAAVASRQDPRHFAGRKPINDLVTRLLATERTTGADAGLFGSADPTFDGAFRQGVALAALAAAHVERSRTFAPAAWLMQPAVRQRLVDVVPAGHHRAVPGGRPEHVRRPRHEQHCDGRTRPCRRTRSYPNVFRTAVSFAHVRSADGGYPFLAAPGQSSDPDSTALVIQAVIAEHAKPGTAVDALATFQLGCSDPVDSRGAYFFPGSRGVSILATVQSVPAAALKALPLAPSSPSSVGADHQLRAVGRYTGAEGRRCVRVDQPGRRS